MIKRPKMWLGISLATILVSLLIIIGIKPVWGIDFIGGSLLEVSLKETNIEKVRSLAEQATGSPASVQSSKDNRLIIRSTPLSEEDHQRVLTAFAEGGLLNEELRFESIGPTIGAELRQKAVVSILIVVAVLIIYLAYTFRQASGLITSWKFGAAAVYALLHDLLVVIAFFVLLGRVWGVTIDTLFVTAMLALLGYSVNDTIVIFNRLKYEWQIKSGESLKEILDAATARSVIRSLNTSLTTLLVLGSLLLVGGDSIHWFIMALMAGTIVGTYSSLFVAPPALYWLAKK